MLSSYQVVLWKQESFVVLHPLQIEFFRNLLGLLYAFGPQRVVIFPDAPLSRSRPHRQHSPSHACTFDFAQVNIKLVVELRIDKIPHRRPQHFFDAVAQQARWNGIDRQESAVKVVNAQ
jgi:hypothetical protein